MALAMKRLRGNPDEAPSLFRQASPLMVGRTLSMAATVTIPLILARHLNPDSFGTYKQLFLLGTTFHFLLQVGMSQSLFYFIPAFSPQRGSFITQSFLFLTGAGLLGGLFIWAATPLFGQFFNNPQLAEQGMYLAVYVALITATTPLEPALTAEGHIREAAIAYMVTDWVRTLALVLPIVLGGDLTTLMLGAMVFALLRLVCTAIMLAIRRIPLHRPELALMKRHLAYALPFGGAVILAVLHLNFHSYYISYVGDPAIFAIYAVGCFQLPVVNLLYTPISEVMVVRIAGLKRPYAGQQAPALFKEASAKLALAFIPLTVLMLVIANDLIPFLFTEQYLASVAIFMVVVFEVPLAALPADGLVKAMGDTRFLVRANVARVVAAVALVPLGFMLLGLPGAAAGHVLSSLVSKLLVLAHGRALLGHPSQGLIPGRFWGWALLSSSAAAVLALSVSMFMRRADFSRFWILLTTSLTFCSVYFSLQGLRWLQKVRQTSVATNT